MSASRIGGATRSPDHPGPESDGVYRVDFGPDLTGPAARGDYFVTETIRAPRSDVDNDSPVTLRQVHFDGARAVIGLGPESTEDGTYSTAEISSTRRFDQRVLDRLLLEGSPRVVVPGRQAIFRDLVFAPEFADGRATRESVTTGAVMQTWRGIESGDDNFATRPEYIGASLLYCGGDGLLPKLFNGFGERVFACCVVDFRVGIMWFQKLRRGFDPSEPHDVAIRWLRQGDVSFTVDGREVGRYVDGKVRVYPMKLRGRGFFTGTDLVGHRYLTPDPCHIDVWINSSSLSTTPEVPTGGRFSQNLWLALAGFGVEPV